MIQPTKISHQKTNLSMCTIIYVDKAESTNTLLSSSARQFDHGTVLAAHCQSAGRGQRGNKWESEPNKNLTFSLLLKPSTIVASRQFELSQIVSIAITRVLRSRLDSDKVCIKWPNDIYYADKKLCGILIENSLSGANIEQSIVGVGINVNQEQFRSDAPNPVSMFNIAGNTFDLDSLLEDIVTQIVDDFDNYELQPDSTTLAAKYRLLMWRAEGFWPYHDNITDSTFEGRIAAVAPTGHLTLATKGGAFHTYAFKEISFVIDEKRL